MVDEVPTLKTDYDTAVTTRTDQRAYILDNTTDVVIDEFDPAAGEAPPLPEEPTTEGGDDKIPE